MKKNVKRIIGFAAALTMVLMITDLSGTVKQSKKVDDGSQALGKYAANYSQLYADFSSQAKASKVIRPNVISDVPRHAINYSQLYADFSSQVKVGEVIRPTIIPNVPRHAINQKPDLKVIDSNGDVGRYCSVAVDSYGFPHISYYDATQNCLKYARFMYNSWNIQTVDPKVDVGADTSIAVDNNGFPHISYYDATQNCLKYARLIGTLWDIQKVHTKGNIGKSTSIAVDSSGQTNIKYFDETSGKVKSAKRTGYIWGENKAVSELMPLPLYDRNASASVDSDGVTHYVYYDEVSKDLVYTKGLQGPPVINNNKNEIAGIVKPQSVPNETNFLKGAIATCNYDLDIRKELILDFGPYWGIWVYENGTNWRWLIGPDGYPAPTAKTIVAANFDADAMSIDDIAFDFGPQWGMWVYYNNSDWVQIHNSTGNTMIAGNFTTAGGTGQIELVVDFGPPWGLYMWQKTQGWKYFYNYSTSLMAAGHFYSGTTWELLCDFGPYFGIWFTYNAGLSWIQLHTFNCNGLLIKDWNMSGNADIFIDFGPAGGGVWVLQNPWPGTWIPVVGTSSCMEVGNLHGALYNSLIVNRGPARYWWDMSGIIEVRNYAPSDQNRIHPLTAKYFICGDLDHIQAPTYYLDEIIVDFGDTYGIWILYNYKNWVQLNSSTTY